VIVDLKRLSYDLDLNSFPTRRSSDLGMTEVEGPFNATANGKISLTELIQLVEKATGKTAKISLVGNDEIRSPYAIPSSWYMSNAKATEAGFAFSNLDEWLAPLIEAIAKK